MQLKLKRVLVVVMMERSDRPRQYKEKWIGTHVFFYIKCRSPLFLKKARKMWIVIWVKGVKYLMPSKRWVAEYIKKRFEI